MSGKPIADTAGVYRRAMIKGMLGIPLFLLFMLALAFAKSKAWLQQGREVLYILACLCVTAFLIGTVGARCAKCGKLLAALSAELGLVLFVLVLGLLTKDSDFFNMLLLWSGVAVLFGAFLAATLTSGRRRKGRGRRKYNK